MTTHSAMSDAAFYRVYELPWSKIAEESDRLRKIFMVVAGICLFLALVIPFLPSQPVTHNAEADMPARLAKLVIERKTPPPPPVEVIKPKEEVVVEAEPKPEPKPEPKVEEPKPEPKLAFVPEPVVVPPVNEAREKAAKAGLMAMADELADLRDNSSVDAALADRNLSNAVGAAERTERSLLTSSSGRASSGINTAGFSRNTGGQGLAGRSVTAVESPVQTAAAVANVAAGGSASGSAGQRSRDQIEMIFDRNKAAIYALYRRALRKDPTLQGKLVLELTITATGEVADVKILSSELNAPEFEARLIQRVRLFDFGAQDVGTVTTTKPIDFFPV